MYSFWSAVCPLSTNNEDPSQKILRNHFNIFPSTQPTSNGPKIGLLSERKLALAAEQLRDGPQSG
jgi:hypothetical protein